MNIQALAKMVKSQHFCDMQINLTPITTISKEGIKAGS